MSLFRSTTVKCENTSIEKVLNQLIGGSTPISWTSPSPNLTEMTVFLGDEGKIECDLIISELEFVILSAKFFSSLSKCPLNSFFKFSCTNTVDRS